MIQKVAYFLRLIDDDNRINLADLAFVVLLVKITFSGSMDWASVVVLMTTCLNSAHQRHIESKDNSEMESMIKEQAASIKDMQAKITPILDTLRSKIS